MADARIRNGLTALEADMLAAMQAQHQAIDELLAMLIVRDKAVRPSQLSIWPAVVGGHEVIKRAEAIVAGHGDNR